MVYGQHDETGLARQPGSSGKEIQPVLGAELARGAVLQLRRCPVRALFAPCTPPGTAAHFAARVDAQLANPTALHALRVGFPHAML
jgi:hypothetical protein